MKLLCVIDSLGSGGAQRQLVELAIGFKVKGYEVSFLTYHPHEFYKGVLERNHISVTCVHELNYIKRFIKMRKYIRSGNFNAVLSFLEASNFICEVSSLPYRKWKLIVGERSANPTIFTSLKLRTYRWFHFLADNVVANSHANLSIVRDVNPFLSREKTIVIYNMLDLENWKGDKSYIPLKNNKLNIVVAASHQKLKNLNGLIEAVNLLNVKEKFKLRIKWYGDHGFDSSFAKGLELIKKYDLSKVFKFNNATLNIKEKMQHADVVALFSKYEGLPNALCEAMAIGKPILATKISDLPLIINNSCGILCDSDDPKRISIALKKYLNMNSSQLLMMGINSRKKARMLFSKEEILCSYEALIDQ